MVCHSIFCLHCIHMKRTHVPSQALLVAQLVKDLLAMPKTLVQVLGQEDILEKGQDPHSSVPGLPWCLSWWRIRLQCGRPGFDHWLGKIPWKREQLPTPAFWPEESHGESHGVPKSWTWLSDFHSLICHFNKTKPLTDVLKSNISVLHKILNTDNKNRNFLDPPQPTRQPDCHFSILSQVFSCYALAALMHTYTSVLICFFI